MRLFTHISFLSTLLATLASTLMGLVAIFFFGVPRLLLLAVIPVACITYFLSLIMARFISQPLKELSVKAQRYRQGDKTVTFTTTGSIKEIDELSESLSEFVSLSEARQKELVVLKKHENTFVSDVAHEFRTPLTAISGNAELMLDPDMPQETREHFCEIILSEAERLKKLTNNVLALQHVQENDAVAELSRLNIKPIAKDVIDILNPLAQDKNVTLTVHGECPDILGNSDRLKQALINLVDNAIRHVTEGGKVEILLSGLNGKAVVNVKDNGCGFGDIDPDLLFKRFYRTDSSRARNSGGAGLGLAIVKEIVEAHDGEITAVNAPDGGAMFVMALPAVD